MNSTDSQENQLSPHKIRAEIRKCAASRLYFINNYCQIYDAVEKNWIPFKMWPAQIHAHQVMNTHQFSAGLKTRQVGLTWEALADALWDMLFAAIATVLIFSRRDDEAIYLLGEERLRGMYRRLPEWMQARKADMDNAHVFRLSNGSVARAFPTSGGDSYTATRAIIDEADLVADLGTLLASVRPTIEAGGKLILIGRSDKSRPNSEFKNIYRAAKNGESPGWGFFFLPWYAHPGRTLAWYNNTKAEILAQTGALDMLHEQYPATDAEAMAPATLDKRIPPAWVTQCYTEAKALTREDHRDIPDIPGLTVYRLPDSTEDYVIGIDPAEGNPTSDDSALTVMLARTLEEVATLSGKLQPAIIAAYADRMGQWYSNAGILCERNNHGHAVILWLEDNSSLDILLGHDGREGWNSSSLGKVLLYDAGADAFRDGDTIIHTFRTLTQIQSIEGGTLRAPEGQMDDLSDSYMLCLVGAEQAGSSTLRLGIA